MDTEENRFQYLEIDDEPAREPVVAPAPKIPMKTVAEITAARELRESARTMPSLDSRHHVMPIYVEQPAAPVNKATSRITAVQEADATTSAITYFQTHKGIDLEALRTAWEAEGMDPKALLGPPSPKVALTRALRTLEDPGILIDDHPRGGSALVVRTAVNSKLVYATAARAFLDRDNALVVEREDADESTHAMLTDVLRVEHAQQLRTLAGSDVGNWLVWLVADVLRGVALRSTGGIYFVPPEGVEQLQKIKRACAAVGVIVHVIPAVRSRDTINAVLDAVARQATQLLATVREQMTEERGKRWVASRLEELSKLDAQLTTYERFLGMSLDAARTDLINTRALLDAHATRGNLLEVE